MRRALKVAAVLAAIAAVYLAGSVILAPPAGPTNIQQDPDLGPRFLNVENSNSTFWPYLSKQQAFEKQSPINVIVVGATLEEVVDRMVSVGWNETRANQTDATSDRYVVEPVQPEEEEGTEVPWGQAAGADRYAYVIAGDEGRWIRQDDQLHDGTYFGHRIHIRLYTSPIPGEWVLMQVHSEHFDWFTLRHAVDGVAEARQHVEADLMAAPFVQEVWRMHVGNEDMRGSDGWATVAEFHQAALPLAALALVLPRALRRHLTEADRARLESLLDRLTWRHGALLLAAGAPLLVVRAAGILLEHQVRALGPHAIAGLLFPLVALGIPALAVGLAIGMERRMDAGTLASISLGAATLLDDRAVGVEVLPLEIVLHRVGLIVAIGLIAAGATQRASRKHILNSWLITGLGAWALLLAAILFGWI